MKVDVELEPFTPLLRPTYADAHAGAISEVRMEGYEFGHTYVWSGPATYPDRNEWRPNPLSYALSVFSFAGVGVQSRLRMRYRAQFSCARGAFFLGGG